MLCKGNKTLQDVLHLENNQLQIYNSNSDSWQGTSHIPTDYFVFTTSWFIPYSIMYKIYLIKFHDCEQNYLDSNIGLNPEHKLLSV